MKIDKLSDFQGFDWDEGNSGKNLRTHNLSDGECETVFFNTPIVVLPDQKHSDLESRYAIFGVTNTGRLLIVIFTMRGRLVRVISARDMNRRERKWFHSYEEDTEV